MNIAQLGVEVNSSDAVQATTNLERLAQAGAKAEKAAEGVSAGFDKAATATAGLAAAEGKLSESTEDAMKRLTAMAKASLDSSDYYQRLTTSVSTNSTALEASGSSLSSLAALQKRLQAESDALVGSTDRQAEAAKRAAAASGVQAEGLQELLGKINPTVAALDKLDQQQAQLQKYKAAGLIDADTFREYSTRIDASRQKLGEFDEGLHKAGVSSRQTEAALRQLPAQFTDIFTSLAGGQNPLMVLIQQGGQIKDSFGGIGPTMDALKDKFRSLFAGGAGAAVLGESLAGIAANSKDVADNAGEAGESLSSLAENSNTAAEAAENAKKAYGALPPSVTGASASIVAMTVAVVAAAAAVGVLIYGYSRGSKEADEYNKSLILTGNYAGTSANELANLAQQVSATNGTVGEAAASLAKLAGSGVVAGESFKDIADAAAAMEDATGKSVDATIAEFVKIAKDPVAAAKELNEQYHFLTASVYSQIVALKDQGNEIGATKLLTETYAEVVKVRAAEMAQNLGLVERAWKGIKSGAADALDATLSIGRQMTLAQQAQDLERKLSNPSSYSAIPIIGEDNPNLMEVGNTREEDEERLRLLNVYMEIEKRQGKYLSDIRKSEEAAADGMDLIRREALSAQTQVEKLQRKLTDLDKARQKNIDNNSYSPEIQKQYEAATAGVKKQIADAQKKALGPSGAVDLTGFNAAQNALKEIQADYSNTQKQLDAAQKAGLISQQEYLLKREALIGNERDEVTAAYEAEISALESAKGKATTTGEQRIQLDQKIADARADMIKAQKAADSELDVLATAEKGRIDKQTLNINRYIEALGEQQKALELSGRRAVVGVGQGDRQNALSGELNSQQDRFAQQSLELANQQSDPSRKMSQEEFNRKSQALADANKKATDQIRQNYADVEAAQGDWMNGATAAWDNYLDSARDVAGQTKALFGNTFAGMEDALVNFAMTGKLSFADLTKSIIADMARIAARQAASSALSSLFGLAASVAGAYFGGTGGATGAATAGGAQAGASNFGSQFDASSGSVMFPQALGGAWSNGVQMFADGGAFSNSVVSKPTAFGMAGGKAGVMGEAGPEAIMPLTRTAGGKLGVLAAGGGGGSVMQISAPVSVVIEDRSSEGMSIDQNSLQQNLKKQIQIAAEKAVADSWRPGAISYMKANGRV